ncbi:hypothetical protein AB0O18_30665 [Streptomyces sp. NPDC093224]|uniref:hypothetical protein n=1 Tax=Streptomyces sp. NPDC093224 TaxID=3155198 RepID=UPI003449268C
MADAKRVWGPLTEGLTIPRDLDLGNRPRALKQLRVQPAAHSQMVAMVKEVLPEREAGPLIGSRPWPLLAVRISAAGTDRWADLLKATMPEGLVRDAILTSPSWPDMAAMMPRLDSVPPNTGARTALRGCLGEGDRQGPRFGGGFAAMGLPPDVNRATPTFAGMALGSAPTASSSSHGLAPAEILSTRLVPRSASR